MHVRNIKNIVSIMFFTHEWRHFVQLHQTRDIFVVVSPFPFLLYQSLFFMVYFLPHFFFLLSSSYGDVHSFLLSPSPTYTRKKGIDEGNHHPMHSREKVKVVDMEVTWMDAFDVCERERGKVSPSFISPSNRFLSLHQTLSIRFVIQVSSRPSSTPSSTLSRRERESTVFGSCQ